MWICDQVFDHKEQVHVALKIVRNEKRFHRQAQEEVRILQFLGRQDSQDLFNIVHIYDNFTFRNHVCITFELLNLNLYELIKKNRFQGFKIALVRKFAHSLLQCLDLCYRNRIVHCDLKPENILLRQSGRSGLKVGTLATFAVQLSVLLKGSGARMTMPVYHELEVHGMVCMVIFNTHVLQVFF